MNPSQVPKSHAILAAAVLTRAPSAPEDDGPAPDAGELFGSATNAQLRMAVDLAGIASWRHDLATGVIANNAHGWAILGLEPRPQGLRASELRALLHPDDEAEVFAPVAAGAPDRSARGHCGTPAQWRRALAFRDGALRSPAQCPR